MSEARNLILVLGDQLTPQISSLRASDPRHDRVLMVESMEEATYVRHHKKKIAFILSAMRHFAEELREAGWSVDYIHLDHLENRGGFIAQLEHAIARYRPASVIVTEPGEWRVLQMLETFKVTILPDDRFLCTTNDFKCWANERKQLRMEYFYRDMRRKTGLLMVAEKPVGGVWNYDAENRKAARADLLMPRPKAYPLDAITQEVLELVASRFAGHFGDLEPFSYAVTRGSAEDAFEYFVEHALANFGDYQDAMLVSEPFLYHSVIAQYLNCGLLDPLTICRRVEAAYTSGTVPLNAAEGYIRQVIGWREYIRGIYWLKMPDYAEVNFFNHQRPLPDFYWSANTDMKCIRATVEQTKEYAYAHHIQRLMVTGNFAMLVGVNPQQLHEWYLSVYADAYEWVELPNTLGMSQYADGGMLASKPYAASGAYINRMSNYCESCVYDVKLRTGKEACPFNALYWNFLNRHRDKLASNPRIGNMIRTYDKFSVSEQDKIAASSAEFLARIY